MFGGPAWTRVVEPDGNLGQWYLHLFDPEQPDLNWDNPEIFDDLEKTLRFWLDRGVDGFRIDVAHGMAKPPGLPDMRNPDLTMLTLDDDDPRFNHDGVHEIHRGIRSVLDDYPHAVTIGEIWVFDNEDFAKYLRPDELHLGFNFRLVRAEFDAADIREAIENSLAAAELAGSPATWCLSNHDVEREVSRYGGGAARAGAGQGDGAGDAGAAWHRCSSTTAKNSGLPNVDLPDEVLQDPTWERSGHQERGRDGCRVPMPWEGDAPPFGFSSDADTWLPMPAEWASLTVEAQERRPRLDVGAVPPGDRIAPWPCGIRRPHRVAGHARGCAAFRGADGLVCVLNTGADADRSARRRRVGLERCSCRRQAAAEHRRLARPSFPLATSCPTKHAAPRRRRADASRQPT